MDCKTCEHGEMLYRRVKGDRFTATYEPTGRVQCAAPRYKGRSYTCRDDRCGKCGEYKKRERDSVNE